MKAITAGDVLLTILAVAVVIAVTLVAIGYDWLPSGRPNVEEIPVPLGNEFPSPSPSHYASLEDTATWLTELYGGGRLENVQVVTNQGKANGVQGIVFLDSYAELPQDFRYSICGIEGYVSDWHHSLGKTKGFYVVLLDGKSQPFHLVPLVEEGRVPRRHDLGFPLKACPLS